MMAWANWWNETLDSWQKEGLNLPAPQNGLSAGDVLKQEMGLDLIPYLHVGILSHDAPQPAYSGGPVISSMEEYQRMKPFFYPKNPFDSEKLRALAKLQKQGDIVFRLAIDGFFWGPRSLLGIEPHLLAFYDEPEFVEWCFKKAEEYFPNNQLVINEYTGLCWGDRCRATDKYYSYIEANMLKGARIDAIGMQYHLFHKSELEYEKTRLYLNPESLYRHMDMYSGFGKPLQITEVTVPAYSWNDEDEQIQADIIEKLYSIWFSHPNVEQIIYWNLVDGYAHLWDPDPEKIAASQGDMSLGENYYYGGLLRFDLSPKPAYFKIKELVKERWHTREEALTDTNGELHFRGFYGTYGVEISVGGVTTKKTLTLSSKKDNAFNITI